MKRLKRISSVVLIVVLLSQFFTISAFADELFIDSPHWQEVSTQTIKNMYNNQESFVVMFFRYTCFNSNLRKVMVKNWMETYGLDVYGVDCDQNGVPAWVFQNVSAKGIMLPVICFVKDGTAESFTADDSMRSIQKRLQEYLGINDSSGEVNFSRLNTDTYRAYSLHAVTAASYCMPAEEIPDEIRTEAENIVQGLSSDMDRLKAIYDWVTTNIFYNYGMMDGTYPKYVSAWYTYYYRNSVCSGFANLTSALCNAVGIPCRVVTGFATGVEVTSTVSDVWSIYSEYLSSGDLAAFSKEMAPYVNHAWNEAYIDGRWVILDTTWGCNNDYYPDQGGKIYGEPTDAYFDPALEWFSDSHLFWTDRSLDLTVTVNNSQIVVSGALDMEEAAAADHLLLALYDTNNRLLECSPVDLSGTAFSQSVANFENAAKVKVFLLTESYTPSAPPLLGKVA